MKSDLPVSVTKWCFAAIVVLSVSLQWYGHACGLLLTPDSENYVSASKSLKADGTFKSPDGSLYTYWPPLFPATLSIFDAPEKAMPWMYGVVTILIGIVSILILNQLLQRNLFRIIVLLLTLISVQFMMISVFLWSEMNFLLLVLCVTYCALHLHASRRYWIGLSVFAVLMCLQRNAGVFILAGVCSWILLDTAFSLKTRIVKSVIIFLTGISGLIAWNIYLSYIIESGFFFYRHEFFIHAAENFLTLSTMLVRIFIPLSGWVAGVLGLFMFAALIFHIKGSIASVRLIGLILLFYGLGLICLFRIDIYDVDRFLAPIILFIYVIAFERLEKWFLALTKPARIILATVLLLWIAYPAYRTVTNLKQWNSRSCEAVSER